MRNARIRILFFQFTLAALCATFATRASAQWTQDYAAPGNVTCLRWLQDVGSRLLPAQPLLHQGFAGGCAPSGNGGQWISFCPAGGDWTPATTLPSIWNAGWISDFAFESQTVGYASIYGAPGSAMYVLGSGIMKTTDGGATWNFVTGAPPEVRGMFYNWTNHTLFCSSGGLDDIGAGPSAGVWSSSDHGSTWQHVNIPQNTSLDSECYYTGFASWNGTDIVLATEGSPNPCSSNPTIVPWWLISHDGGATWKTSLLAARSWQPAAMKNTHIFYASNNAGNQIFQSLDNGNTWGTTAFIIPGSNLTECMSGDPCMVVAPDSTGPGVYTSADDGATWSPFLPGPTPPIDYRGYSGGDSIWAFSGRQISSFPRPLARPIHIYPTKFNFGNSGCFTSDTTITIYPCNCNTDTLVSGTVAVVGGANNFQITQPFPSAPSPHLLCNPETFHVTYTPTSPNKDTSSIALLFDSTTASSSPVRDTILGSGNGAPAAFFVQNWSTQKNVNLFVTTCSELDTFLTIINPTCSDVSVTRLVSVDVTPPGSTGVIKVGPVSTPFTVLRQGGEQVIPISVLTSTSGPASYEIALTIETTINGKTIDSTYYIYASISGKAEPFIRGFDTTVTYACIGTLGTFDSAAYFFNNTCEHIIITKLPFFSNPTTEFEIDTTQLPKVHFPDTLITPSEPGGNGLTFFMRTGIKMTCTEPGVHKVWLHYDDILIGSGQNLHDSVLLEYTIQKAIDLSPQIISGPHLKFGCITPCDTSAQVMFIYKNTNPCNDPVTLTSFSADTNGANGNPPTYTISKRPPIGKVLAAGQLDTIVVNWPYGTLNTPPGGFVTIKLSHQIDPAVPCSKDSAVVEFTFDGYVCPNASASLLSAVDSFPTLRAGCDAFDILDTLYNKSCGSVTLQISTATTLTGRTVLVSPANGATIPPNGALPVQIHFQALPGDSGLYSGTIQFLVQDMNNSSSFVYDTLTWSANVTKLPISATVSAIATPDSIACGKTWDTTICIANTSSCRAITVTGATPTSSNITVSGAWPVTLPPDSSYCFTAHFDPGLPSTPGVIAGAVAITGDTSFSVPYSIPYQACSTNDTFYIVSGDSIFNVKNCVDTTTTWKVEVVGASRDVSFAITGNKFTQSASSGPTSVGGGNSVSDVITYGDTLNYTSNGTLTITVTGTNGTYTRTVPLQGTSSGAPASARVGIAFDPPPMVIAADSARTNSKRMIDVILRDPIVANTGLTTVNVTLDFSNYDVLTLTPSNVTGLNGWTPNNPTLPTTGPVQLSFTTSQQGPFAASMMIGQVNAMVSLGGVDSTTITVKQTAFNDANFEACTLASQPATDTLTEHVLLGCTDSILMDYNGTGTVPMKDFRIIPNPAHKSDGSSVVQFTSTIDANGTVEVLDLMGNVVTQLASGPLTHGDHSFSIPTATMTEGTYFARIRVGGFTIVRKFVLQKD